MSSEPRGQNASLDTLKSKIGPLFPILQLFNKNSDGITELQIDEAA